MSKKKPRVETWFERNSGIIKGMGIAGYVAIALIGNHLFALGSAAMSQHLSDMHALDDMYNMTYTNMANIPLGASILYNIALTASAYAAIGVLTGVAILLYGISHAMSLIFGDDGK